MELKLESLIKKIEDYLALCDKAEELRKAREDLLVPPEQRKQFRQEKAKMTPADIYEGQLTSVPGRSDRGIEVLRADPKETGAIAHGYARVDEPAYHQKRARQYFRDILAAIKKQPKLKIPGGLAKADVLDFFTKRPLPRDEDVQDIHRRMKNMPKTGWPEHEEWSAAKANLKERFGDNENLKRRLIGAHAQTFGEPYIDGDSHNVLWSNVREQKKHWNEPIPFPVETIPEKVQGVLGKEVAQGGPDPFMWMDAKYKRGLQTLKDHKDKPLQIHTRSDLLAHQDYLEHLNPQHHQVFMHVLTDNGELGRLMEPGAPSTQRRLAAAQKIKLHGVPVQIVQDKPTYQHMTEGLKSHFNVNISPEFKTFTNEVRLTPKAFERVALHSGDFGAIGYRPGPTGPHLVRSEKEYWTEELKKADIIFTDFKNKKTDQPKMSQFKVGDHVVYPGHGPGTIVASTDLMGTPYHDIKLHNDMKIRVPADQMKQVGVRPIMSKEQAERIQNKTLMPKQVYPNATWNRTYRDMMEHVKSGDPEKLAGILQHFEYKKQTGELSFGERKMLDTAREQLKAEFDLINPPAQKSEKDKMTLMKSLLEKVKGIHKPIHGHHTIPIVENLDWYLEHMGDPHVALTAIKDIPKEKHLQTHKEQGRGKYDPDKLKNLRAKLANKPK